MDIDGTVGIKGETYLTAITDLCGTIIAFRIT